MYKANSLYSFLSSVTIYVSDKVAIHGIAQKTVLFKMWNVFKISSDSYYFNQQVHFLRTLYILYVLCYAYFVAVSYP
jgi:hypothetical protein